jgi:hypothetical protein
LPAITGAARSVIVEDAASKAQAAPLLYESPLVMFTLAVCAVAALFKRIICSFDSSVPFMEA